MVFWVKKYMERDGFCRSVTSKLNYFLPRDIKGKKNRVYVYHGFQSGSAGAHILTPSLNVAFRPKSGFKSKCRARTGFRLVISGSGDVQASTWGPFTTLCGYADRGQQGEIERIHPPPTNSKNRLKSFCEVGYANFRPNGQLFLLLVRG